MRFSLEKIYIYIYFRKEDWRERKENYYLKKHFDKIVISKITQERTIINQETIQEN